MYKNYEKTLAKYKHTRILTDTIMENIESAMDENEDHLRKGLLTMRLNEEPYRGFAETDNVMAIAFALVFYVNKPGGKTLVQQYAEQQESLSEEERWAFNILQSGAPSLFKIVAVHPSFSTIVLENIITKEKNINLFDMSLSQTAKPGMLMCCHLFNWEEFYTSSGFTLMFPPAFEKTWIKSFKQLSRKVKTQQKEVRRLITLTWLSFKDGYKGGIDQHRY